MITFGDIPLLVPDAELQAFVDRTLPLEEAHLYGRLPTFTGSRTASTRHAVELPVYNWPDCPPPRLNTLYWPSGASRWARGWFLCDGKSKDAIVALCHPASGTVSQVLKFGTETEAGNPFVANAQLVDMYLLPPRPLSGSYEAMQTAAEKKETLWLLPLVDRRYFFQFISSGLLEPTTSTTWATLFASLETALGIDLEIETVDADYLTPDPVEFTRRYSSCGLLLDAAAASVGQRIIKDPETNTYKSLDVSASETVYLGNIALDVSRAAGYEFDDELGDMPANVRVNYRRWSQYQVYCDGEVYTATSAATSLATPPTSTLAGQDKIFHSTLFAEYPAGTAPNSGSSPTNSAQLSTLTAQIATDFYGWLGKRFDICFNGIVDWSPTGFDDAIVWEFGHTARTRVWSLPSGVGVSTQLSQSSSYQVLETLELGKPDADIAAAASGTVSVWRRDSTGALADSTLNVTATALAGAVTSAVYVTLFWNCGTWLVSCYES